MSYQVVNETRLVVEQEIDAFIADFASDHPFRMALSLPYFRNILTAKILNKIPNRHKLRTSKFKNFISTQPINGIQKERLLIEEMIHALMPEIISDKRYSRLVNRRLFVLPEKSQFHNIDPAWWIKIHTMIPCVTYYFGPFDTQKEAKKHYPGYLADLESEKAIGISAYFEFIKPNILTVTDSPVELKQDVKKMWQKLEESRGKLAASQQALQDQLNTLPGNYILTGLDGKIKSANTQALGLFGLELNELQGRSIELFVPQQQLFCIDDHLKMMCQDQDDWQTPYCWSMKLQFPQNAPISVDVDVTQQKNAQGQVVGWYWSLHETSFTEAEIQQLHFESRHDSLTLLPNRILLSSLMEPLRQHGFDAPSDLFAFLFIDINKFKLINDRFGHQIGDRVLQLVSQKLLSCVRDCDHVARIGGDEFLIVINKMESTHDAKSCALRIHHAFAQPFNVAGHEIFVAVSIGIVVGDDSEGDGNGYDHDLLVHYADMAMYEAKKEGKAFVLVNSSQLSSNGNGNGNGNGNSNGNGNGNGNGNINNGNGDGNTHAQEPSLVVNKPNQMIE